MGNDDTSVPLGPIVDKEAGVWLSSMLRVYRRTHHVNTGGRWHARNQLLKVGGGCLVAKLCPTLVTPCVACQAPLSMGFSRQEYWGGLPFPSRPRDQTQVSCIAGRLFTD